MCEAGDRTASASLHPLARKIQRKTRYIVAFTGLDRRSEPTQSSHTVSPKAVKRMGSAPITRGTYFPVDL